MGNIDQDIAGDIGTVPTCKTCGSERVVRDAWACFNPSSGLWELETVFDQEFCHQCETETSFRWKRVDSIPRQRIAELNDAMRTTGRGHGTVVVTAGILALDEAGAKAALDAVQAYDTFTPDSDPWGEHDFGAVEVGGEKIFWKIDYYTSDLSAGSENPANEGETLRILTIMLATEY